MLLSGVKSVSYLYIFLRPNKENDMLQTLIDINLVHIIEA
jgi:hypothetical protein